MAAALHLNPAEQQKVRLARITGYNETQMAARRVVARNGKVLNGIDILEERKFDPLRVANVAKPRIGLVTNQTGVDSRGKRTIDVLNDAPGMQLTAIFSPEHGAQGTADTTSIANSKDPKTGVTDLQRLRRDRCEAASAGRCDPQPRRDCLRSAGCRRALLHLRNDAGIFSGSRGQGEEADRRARSPESDYRRLCAGTCLRRGQESFVNYYSLPVRHGMTIGELAKLFNEEKKIDADLTVIPMRGWLRGDWFDSTDAMWINPSPNIRNLDQATLYPGVALIEGTSVSVGRGTDTPFQLIGSPYFDGERAVDLSERPQHRRRALCADDVHPDVRTVRTARVFWRVHHGHESRAAGCSRVGDRTGGGAA